MRRGRFVLAGLLTVTASALAWAGPPSSVDELTVTRSGNTLTVEGRVAVGDASDAVVATDPMGDAFQAGIGGDVTSARIERGPNETLRFTLGIADPLPTVFTVPEVVHYHWQITVFNGSIKVHYLLQAMRTGQYERTLPSADPLFRVNSCSALASGAPNCFEVAGYVSGTMANGIVQWVVPRGLIGAFDGSVVAVGPNGLKVQPGASGAAYGGQNIDVVSPVSSYVVGPVVALALRPVEEAPPFEYFTPTALGPDGTFVGKLAAPVAGDYQISARGCNGDATACGYREITFTI